MLDGCSLPIRLIVRRNLPKRMCKAAQLDCLLVVNQGSGIIEVADLIIEQKVGSLQCETLLRVFEYCPQ